MFLFLRMIILFATIIFSISFAISEEEYIDDYFIPVFEEFYEDEFLLWDEENSKTINSNEKTFIYMLEKFRKKKGCKRRLIFSANIEKAAILHSREMKKYRYLSHINRRGEGPGDRLENAGVSFEGHGENIAKLTKSTGKKVFYQWYSSKGHRDNMANCAWTHHGISEYKGYWTHLLIAK